MRLRVGQHDGEWAIFDDDVDHVLPDLRVGNDHLAEQWAHWWVSVRTMPDDTPRWIEDGLRAFTQKDRSVLYVYDGIPVGTLGWNGREWFFWPILTDGELEFGSEVFIEVDQQAREQAVRDQQAVAVADESVRQTLQAELNGRLRMLRDETYELAHLRAMFEAKKVWRRRTAYESLPAVERAESTLEELHASGLPLREIAALKGMTVSAVREALKL